MIKIKQSMFHLTFIISAFVLAACVSKPNYPIPSPTASSTITIEDIERYASNPDYMLDCKSSYPTSYTNQLSYNGIVVGKTTKQEIEELLGSPSAKKQSLIEVWTYEGGPGLVFDNSIVKSIWIYEDPAVLLPPEQFVEKYGCPDIILAYDLDEHPTGQLGMTSFVYHNMGFEINYYMFPVLVNHKPDFVVFEKQESLIEYLNRNFSTVHE